MCGRVAQYQGLAEYGSMLKIDWTKNLGRGLPNTPLHYNGAPSIMAPVRRHSGDEFPGAAASPGAAHR